MSRGPHRAPSGAVGRGRTDLAARLVAAVVALDLANGREDGSVEAYSSAADS